MTPLEILPEAGRRRSRWLPTWKWWAATITAAGTLVGIAITGDGINTDDEKLMIVGVVVQRLVAWVTPNADD